MQNNHITDKIIDRLWNVTQILNSSKTKQKL